VQGAGRSYVGNGEQQFVAAGERGIGEHELLGGATEPLDGALLGLDTALHIATDDGGQSLGERSGAPAILLRRQQVGERFEPARHGHQLQGRRRRWTPRHEGHARGKFAQYGGVQLIVLTALHQGLREVANGARVGHHDRHAGLVQSLGQVQAVEPGGFQGHPHRPHGVLQEAQDRLMACAVLGTRAVIDRDRERATPPPKCVD
jgi:hypothetical protein